MARALILRSRQPHSPNRLSYDQQDPGNRQIPPRGGKCKDLMVVQLQSESAVIKLRHFSCDSSIFWIFPFFAVVCYSFYYGC